MARIRYVEADTAPPATANALARMPTLNVFGLMANAESAFVPWLKLGGVLLSDLALDPLLRELVILQVGRLAARYEWDQHVGPARACGATDEQIATLERGELDAPCWTAAQRAVLAFVADFVRDGEVPEETYAAVAAELDDRRVAEVALTAGFYLGLARMMTALRIDPDAPLPPGALRFTTRS